MTSIEEIAADFAQIPNTSVSHGGKFIKVKRNGGTDALTPVTQAYEDEIELAGDHPAYDMTGRVLTIVYKYTGDE